MTITSDMTVTIERYQRGTQRNLELLLIMSLLISLLFIAIGVCQIEVKYVWAGTGMLPLLAFLIALRLRSVTYEINPVKRELHRESRWAGILLYSQTLLADDFTCIEVNRFSCINDREQYWAHMMGAKKYLLVESIDEAEVARIASLAGELLGLKVYLD